MTNQVFLSYNDENRDFAEAIARRLKGDARLAFWFDPWHRVPGEPIQDQMEDALDIASSCALFIGRSGVDDGWQNEQMRAAIQKRVEDDRRFRVIPVLLPGTDRPARRDLPRFLRLYEPVEFRSEEDETAFARLLAGILGLPPIQVEEFVHSSVAAERHAPPPHGVFDGGHAVVVGIADYARVSSLPATVRYDAQDLAGLLTDRGACGYRPHNVDLLLDAAATGADVRSALARLAARVGPDDTALVFFSGHGARRPVNGSQYIIPHDCDPRDPSGTAISGEEMTALLRAVRAARLLAVFDCCHAAGAAEPKGEGDGLPGTYGLSEGYFETLAQGAGRVVLASARGDEKSWTVPHLRNSLFTHFLLEALRGRGTTLNDGYVRVFDLFRHVAAFVPREAANMRRSQHPVFKAAAMEQDFPVALAGFSTSQRPCIYRREHGERRGERPP